MSSAALLASMIGTVRVYGKMMNVLLNIMIKVYHTYDDISR